MFIHVRPQGMRPTLLKSPDSDGGAGSSGGAGNGHGAGGDGSSGNDVKKFTQADVDRIAAERGERGRQAGANELLKKFGVEKVEDIETALGEFKKLREAQQSDLEKAAKRAEEIEKKRAELEGSFTDAQGELAQLKLQLALVETLHKQKIEFVSDSAREDALEHLLRQVVTDDAGAPKNMDDALKALRKDRAYLFKDAGSGGHGTPPREAKRPPSAAPAPNYQERPTVIF